MLSPGVNINTGLQVHPTDEPRVLDDTASHNPNLPKLDSTADQIRTKLSD